MQVTDDEKGSGFPDADFPTKRRVISYGGSELNDGAIMNNQIQNEQKN